MCQEFRQVKEEINTSDVLYPDESRKPAVDNTLGEDIDIVAEGEQ